MEEGDHFAHFVRFGLQLQGDDRSLEGVFGISFERAMEVVDWSFLVEDHSKWLSKDVVQLVEVDRYMEWSQACSCSRDHFLLLDAKRERVTWMIQRELELGGEVLSIWHDPKTLFREENHHVIHKIEIIKKCMRMSDANMLKEASEKHSIR
nr:hypothetical protein [Tanacetum cinerariifolium]